MLLRVVNLPKMAKPELVVKSQARATARLSGVRPTGGVCPRQRATKEQSGTWEVRPDEPQLNKLQESITATRFGRKSARLIVASKRGPVLFVKGPVERRGLTEVVFLATIFRRTAWSNNPLRKRSQPLWTHWEGEVCLRNSPVCVENQGCVENLATRRSRNFPSAVE